MKEIWKLIELLNEYEPYIASDGEHRDNLWGYAYQWHSAVFPKELAESYIISARYWFIKWLVENDKIDLDNEELVSLMSELWERRNPVKCLLMLLSIQDEPIRFLCEIIK
jgi:hypothetical protein